MVMVYMVAKSESQVTSFFHLQLPTTTIWKSRKNQNFRTKKKYIYTPFAFKHSSKFQMKFYEALIMYKQLPLTRKTH